MEPALTSLATIKLKVTILLVSALATVVALSIDLQASSRSSANYTILADIIDFGGQRSTSTHYTQVGSSGLISGTSASVSNSVTTENGYVAQLDLGLTVLTIVSRKMHGSGLFDINLPLSGLPGIECRTGGSGGNHQVIVTFATPVSVGGVSVMSIDGQASGTKNVNGSVVTVSLSAVANAQTIGITLTNVNNGSSAGDVFIPMGVLLGDTSGNATVNSSDVSLTKSKSGQAVNASNFRADVTVNGSINSSDVALVKSKSGTGLP